MVDNRSTGVFGVGGGINFKSGDISGTAAKTADDRASQGTEYFLMGEEQEGQNNGEFVDRSMQLRASLNSLALMNVASVLNKKLQTKLILPSDNVESKTEKKVEPVEDNNERKERQKDNSNGEAYTSEIEENEE